MSFVTDELSPSFSSVRVIVIWSVSTTNADTPRALVVSGSVRAKSRTVPPNAAFVIHCFAPLTCQPSPSGLGARDERARVGPGAGLGEREAADSLAARERRHEPRTLLVGPELQQRQRARRRVDGDRDADAGVRARQLLEHEDVRDEVRAGAAVLLGHADAHQPELAELRAAARAGSRGLGPTPTAYGSISAAANSRASAWISRCSAVSSKSTAGRLSA